ncbi:MAG: hypothetical protein ACLQAT_03755 [Candidatus Binataceae bacterium]
MLSQLERLILTAPNDSTTLALVEAELQKILQDGINPLIEQAFHLKLKRTKDRLIRLADYFKTTTNLPKPPSDYTARVGAEVRALNEALEDDLTERRVLFPEPEKVEYHERPKLFGEPVFEAFPSARADVTAAGNCYATENDTACVFHSMRAGELAMRTLARHLRITRVSGRPLDYSEWGPICGALAAKVKALQQKKGRGPKKAADLKFFSDLASQADYLNEIWRKDVAHARLPYNAPEALNALTRVRDFMQTLAQRVRERQ